MGVTTGRQRPAGEVRREPVTTGSVAGGVFCAAAGRSSRRKRRKSDNGKELIAEVAKDLLEEFGVTGVDLPHRVEREDGQSGGAKNLASR
jgi:hypothetical protein